MAVLVDVHEAQAVVLARRVDDRRAFGSVKGNGFHSFSVQRKIACSLSLLTINSQRPSPSRSRRRTPRSRPLTLVKIFRPCNCRPARRSVSSIHLPSLKCHAPATVSLRTSNEAFPSGRTTPKRPPAFTSDKGKSLVIHVRVFGDQRRVCFTLSLPITTSRYPSLSRSSRRTPLSRPSAARSG